MNENDTYPRKNLLLPPPLPPFPPSSHPSPNKQTKHLNESETIFENFFSVQASRQNLGQKLQNFSSHETRTENFHFSTILTQIFVLFQ